MAVGYVASANSGSQVSVATFNISASLGTGARAGLVFVVTYANVGVPIDTGVTWNGTAMTPLYVGADTNTEPAAVKAYFLDNITNGAVTVSRTNNTVVCVGYAVAISAASATIVSLVKTIGGAGTVTTNGNTSEAGTAASGEVALDDGSPGTNSMRFATVFTGASTPLGQGTNSTSLQTNDQTSFGSTLVRETTAGQGSRNVGVVTGTTDDYAVVAVAVSEAAPKTPQPTALSMTWSGATPTVTVTNNVLCTPTALSMTFSGATPTVAVTNNVLATPSALALTWAGATPDVKTPIATEPTELGLSLTLDTPDVKTPVQASPAALALTWTGDTPDVKTPVAAAPTELALTWTGDTPAVKTPIAAAPASLDMAWTGATPTVVTPVHQSPDPFALVWTGATPDVDAPVHQTPAALALAWTGVVPTVSVSGGGSVDAQPDPFALVWAGATPTVTAGGSVLAIPSPLTLKWRGAKPLVDNGVRETAGGWEPPDERLPHPQHAAPRPLPLGLTFATPEVRVGDDADIVALLSGL